MKMPNGYSVLQFCHKWEHGEINDLTEDQINDVISILVDEIQGNHEYIRVLERRIDEC